MHLYLWHVDRHLRSSDVLMVIPMTEVVYFGGASGATSVVE
jgi:hypothetical protein